MRTIWILTAIAVAVPVFGQAAAQGPELVREAPASAPAPRLAQDPDVETLVSLVLVTAANDAEQDLRELVKSMQSANRAVKLDKKQAKKTDPKANPCNAVNAASWKKCLINIEGQVAKLPASDRAVLDVELQRLRTDIDELSEMGEMNSLRLQTAMDNATKAASSLSNLQKKTSETQQSIVRNIK